MLNSDDLKRILRQIDGEPYPAYKKIKGAFQFSDYVLLIDHVQGDPFAQPSRLRVRIPLKTAGFPDEFLRPKSRAQGVRCFLARKFGTGAEASSHQGSGKSGFIGMDSPRQEVLEATAVLFLDDALEARFLAGLPAHGRIILGRIAESILTEDLPRLVSQSLFQQNLDPKKVRLAAETNEDAEALRAMLPGLGLAAFVADGAVLPRRSGIDPRPLIKNAVPFKSPESLKIKITLPNAGSIAGMGVPKGVTLIVGGGFHGKSTLLKSLELGVYNHCPGDGRELVVASSDAVKIRSEDNRSIAGVDISPFISNLPGSTDPKSFSTQDASGSTSQAANIMEALEAGATVLLIDEDTSATNFMIRDHRMQELIAKENEPITPFVDKVRQLWEEKGVSTILVMGGSGDYFDAADTVIAMNKYETIDVTRKAKKIAARRRAERKPEGGEKFGVPPSRIPLGSSMNPKRGHRKESVKTMGVKTVAFGNEEIDLSGIEQIVHPGQLRAIGAALLKIKREADGNLTIRELIDGVEKIISENGLDALVNQPLGDLAGFRRFELASALNRLRTLRVKF